MGLNKTEKVGQAKRENKASKARKVERVKQAKIQKILWDGQISLDRVKTNQKKKR